VKGRRPPAADRPTAAQRSALKGCDSEALYYGIGMPADPARARLCAFMEAEGEGSQSPFSGEAMLMTIYANGVGARRDLDYATHLACRIDGAPAETHGRVTHLAELKASGGPGTRFHFCDHVTSGLAGGYCAGHEARIAGAKRKAQLESLTRGWSSAERAALARLQSAHAAFAAAHSGGEIDLTGTLRGAFSTFAEERLEEELLAMLKQLAGGTAPRGSAASYRAADARLNAAYRKLLRDTPRDEGPGTVTPAGIREAQRAWVRYRDAFLAFAAAKYPRVGRDALAAWITDKRTEMLLNRPEF
jgi:uncharacterized protein YecT (DUF1311 family)